MLWVCKPFLSPSASFKVHAEIQSKHMHFTALTGYNSSALYENNCSLSAGNKTLHYAPFSYPVHPGWDAGSDAGYDDMTTLITPILTVYMPVANVERTECCYQPKAVLECLRARDFNENSRVAPALAAGTPWPKPLSAGAKGGIAAGVVIFVLAVGGLLLFLWIAKRKKHARAAVAAAAAQSDMKAGDNDRDLPPEADAGFGIYELAPRNRKSELDGLIVSELGGGGGKPSELANTSALAELSAENTRDVLGRGH